MRSKANIKTHPIHPILVTFPIAFFTGSFIFDLLGFISATDTFWQTGYYLQVAGVLAGIIAAIPGFIDFLYTVPPRSTGKKRAAQHGILNVTILLLFALNFFMRMNDSISAPVILLLDAIGIIILSVSGWLGGTLVYRNQIGVDHRYAHAGKWKEKFYRKQENVFDVASTEELKENQMMLLHIGSERIVLARTEDKYVAFEDGCTHRGGTLAGGSITCSTVICPWHGSQFDVNTGSVKAGPAKEPVKIYLVEARDGRLYLSLNP
jgi:uncharacterized membrane protein/nitrite reductase/ring-hydroxylating ferredoxin subunit